MLENLTRAAIPAFLVAKAAWSKANDALMWWAPRRPLPAFPSPVAAWQYIESRYTYTGDPGGGAGDFYLNPQRLQAALEQGGDAPKRLSVDCDDVAGWAYAAMRPVCPVRLLTLYDESGKFGHHVICAGTWNGSAWAIDTNGFRWLPDLTDATICRTWNDLYASLGYRYAAIFDSPYPF